VVELAVDRFARACAWQGLAHPGTAGKLWPASSQPSVCSIPEDVRIQIMPSQVPLARDRSAPRGRLVQTEVWEWQGMGEDQGDEAAAWLSAYLGRPSRLMRYAGLLEVTVPGAWGCS